MRADLARRRRQLSTVIWCGLILLATAMGMLANAYRPIDDVVASARFSILQRAASQTLTVVEIDSRSLTAAKAWPWDRRRYAQAIDNLMAAGATLVAVDVDFSAPSNPASDEALAAAVSRHPGQVALATFEQMESYGAGETRRSGNRPIGPLLNDALLASVNVPVDADGRVRHYSYGASEDAPPSVAALLADAPVRQGAFTVDFGIKQQSIPHLSFEDVYRGRFDPSLVRGKKILLGATALELGDEFATPVGLLPGVIIHALAYESIADGRALMSLSPLALLSLCAVLIAALQPARSGGTALRRLVVRHVAIGGLIIVLPVLLQAWAPISIDIAALLGTQILMAIWATRVELSRQAQAIIQAREASLLHLAMHEPETGLPNRRALLTDIDETIAKAELSVAVFAVGVDRHAEMRGVVGYDVANTLMVQLAARLAELADVDLVAQISSSVLAFARADLSADLQVALARSLRAVETTFVVEGQPLDLFVRIGSASQEPGSASGDALIERATTALNQADLSEDRTVLYDEATFVDPDNNLALMSELRDALRTNDVSLHYQPKRKTSDGTTASVEALCRWHHPVRGRIGPDLFIPIAEQTGQIRALTEWSIVKAIEDQAAMRARGVHIAIALNVSGRLLVDQAFRTHALQLIEGCDADLIFEITETAVIENPKIAAQAIAAYRAAGVRISIDDYGAGLSSLSYLKMLNADELKIDRSLILDVVESARDRLIIKSTVDLAHGLGMTVVSEGVETAEVFDTLAALGCDTIQGYWVSRPLPFDDLITFFATSGVEERQLLVG
ncbi:MAG: EAL domain-containing protein [Pseudomonadota bacterium]